MVKVGLGTKNSIMNNTKMPADVKQLATKLSKSATVDLTIITTGQIGDFNGTSIAVGFSGGAGLVGGVSALFADGVLPPKHIGFLGQIGVGAGISIVSGRGTTVSNPEFLGKVSNTIKQKYGY